MVYVYAKMNLETEVLKKLFKIVDFLLNSTWHNHLMEDKEVTSEK